VTGIVSSDYNLRKSILCDGTLTEIQQFSWQKLTVRKQKLDRLSVWIVKHTLS